VRPADPKNNPSSFPHRGVDPLVFVEGGDFEMGSTEGYSDAKPW
jgi:hypothetical protein